jgi:RimJ/RimL family protein N-acetyltransferase
MTDQLQVRPYVESDEAQVVHLWETVFPNNPSWNVPADDIRRKLAVQRSLFLVGELDGQIIASVMAGFDGHRGWIHLLAVLPDYRRSGFAQAMMNEAEARLRNCGCTKVNLQVRSTNKEVAAFYEKIGYVAEDRISMGKRFKSASDSLAGRQNTGQSIIVNDRIHLSEIGPSDKSAFVEHLDDKELCERMLTIPFPYTDDDADKFLVTVNETTANYGHPAHFAIRDDREQLIGVVGFHDLDCGHIAEFGYWLAKPLWGQGITTDVVRSACDFAFQEWKLVRIIAHVIESNTASARVLEKNGFEFEGLLRKHHRKDGKFIDAKLYALTR